VAREVMMGPMDGVSLEPASRAHPAVGPAADPAAIEQLAEWLVGAKAPLAIVGQPGRHREAVAELVKLSELLGMPIADTRGPVNFPSSHPLFLGGEAEQARSRRPIAVEWLAAALGQVVSDDTIVLEEAVTNSEVIRRHLRRDEPGTVLSSGAPGLGWALGASVGVKLAAPQREVIAVCGDGSFVFGSPVAALWAAQQARAPF